MSDPREDGVNVEEIMRQVRERIREKKGSLYTEDELRDIRDARLEPALNAHELRSGLSSEIQARRQRRNFEFDPETIYRSSRGTSGRMLEEIRRRLRPIQKLFWNPTPLLDVLSQQRDINASQADRNVAHEELLHNLTLEMTKLKLEVQELRNRVLQLQGRLEFQARRQKTLEDSCAEGRSGSNER